MNNDQPVLVMHPDCGRHDTGWGHPDHQGRLPAILSAIERDTPALLGTIAQHQPEHAGLDTIKRVHHPAYVGLIRELAERAEGEEVLLRLDADTLVSPASWDAARAGVGCIVEGALSVVDGEAGAAFALSRPPGHHALTDRAMGFCLFNSIAVAARAVQAERGLERVLIVDWDVHHGNGTQEIFYEDPSVYYLSWHQWPWYPGTGAGDERGSGRGMGTNRNVPIAAGTPAHEYLEVFERTLDAAVAEFTPDMILVSAGFDCMAGDPLGRLLLEPHHLHTMTHLVLERARVVAGGRVAFVLEGGYAPDRLGKGVVAVLHALAGLPPGD